MFYTLFAGSHTEPTLTLTNVTAIMEHVQKWEYVAHVIDIPYNKRDELKKQNPTTAQHKQACLYYWLSHHPAPSWRRLANALYVVREHGALEVLQVKYLKGKCAYMYIVIKTCKHPRPEHDMLD